MRFVAFAAIVIGLGLSACGDEGGAGALLAGGTHRYVTDLDGLRGVATLSSEPLVTHVRVEGEIRSAVARYVLAVDLIGDAGYGDMTDLGANQRMRAHMALNDEGFLLTVNPFGAPTRYQFRPCSDCE